MCIGLLRCVFTYVQGNAPQNEPCVCLYEQIQTNTIQNFFFNKILFQKFKHEVLVPHLSKIKESKYKHDTAPVVTIDCLGFVTELIQWLGKMLISHIVSNI